MHCIDYDNDVHVYLLLVIMTMYLLFWCECCFQTIFFLDKCCNAPNVNLKECEGGFAVSAFYNATYALVISYVKNLKKKKI